MFRYRRINVKNDRAILLELHCRINYESETPYARKLPYDQYKEKWLKTSQPEEYLSHLAKTMKDKRTMAEILEDKDKIVGYLWVTFTEIKDYNITVASVMDIIVVPSYQRRGIGLRVMNHIEETAHKSALLCSVLILDFRISLLKNCMKRPNSNHTELTTKKFLNKTSLILPIAPTTSAKNY